MIELMDKRALVVGVANDQSIAWGVAQALHRGGAELALTYLNEKAEPHVRRGFATAMDISVHSFIRLARADDERRRLPGDELLRRGESRRKLQHDGAGEGGAGSRDARTCLRAGAEQYHGQRLVPRADADPRSRRHRKFRQSHEAVAPRRCGDIASIEDVGAPAAFLSSDNITGGVLYVDAGRHIMS